ncbi:MAG: hypothetical protein P8Y43_06250, partial [Sulfurovaceae bacterium]
SGFDDDQIWVNQSTKPLINHIYNGKNENINISYEPLTNDDIYYNYRLHGSGTGSGGIGGINIFSTASLEKDYELSIPFYVVASAKMANGLGGQDTTSYIYKGYRVNRYRGPLGFYEIYSYHSQKKELEYTKYKQNFPFIGLPSERINYLNAPMPSTISSSSGVKASIKDYTYDDKSYMLNSKTLHQVYAKSVVGKMYDPDSTNLLVTQTDSKVLSEDHLGNIESQTQTTLDHTTDKTHKTTETYEYDNDTANWIIGKVTHNPRVYI